MRTKFKAWAEPYLNEHPEIQVSLDMLPSLNDIYLEIGSGKGYFLIEMAKKFPERSFIGIERNVTCAGFTAKKLVEEEISNAKLIKEDAEKILSLFKEESVNSIYLNFSDPWPKKRHHKRRLTSDRFLPLYKRVLKSDGIIIQKTDNIDLFEYSIEYFSSNGWTIMSEDRNYQLDEVNDVCTEYESDFRKDNEPIYRLVVKK